MLRERATSCNIQQPTRQQCSAADHAYAAAASNTHKSNPSAALATCLTGSSLKLPCSCAPSCWLPGPLAGWRGWGCPCQVYPGRCSAGRTTPAPPAAAQNPGAPAWTAQGTHTQVREQGRGERGSRLHYGLLSAVAVPNSNRNDIVVPGQPAVAGACTVIRCAIRPRHCSTALHTPAHPPAQLPACVLLQAGWGAAGHS